MFLHESNRTVVWLRHMRWWRRWQLAIPLIWASGYERAKARHLVPRQNWKYCAGPSQAQRPTIVPTFVGNSITDVPPGRSPPILAG